MWKWIVPVVVTSLFAGPIIVFAQSVRTYTFQYEMRGSCVKVTVTKSATVPRTRIRSDGYSVPCSEISSSSRALQRTVELRY